MIVLEIFLGWLLACGIIIWMQGWQEGIKDLKAFHKFIVRPWKYR